jgi:hypothetical protein
MLIIQRLHELLRPFMLRRVKSAVMHQLPTKVEKVLKCELSGYQRKLYKDITNRALRLRLHGAAMNNMMMHLRKCCNHPFLFQDRYTIDNSLVSMSGKVELLDRILPKLKASGHRILLFSQMTQVLDILDDYFSLRGYKHLRLDGQTPVDDREQRMYQFNAPDSPYFIFALSTRAGGLGLNLATADTVIFFDSDWNPSMDSQAMDRAHRIGQKNDVRVFRLITNTSVEEKIISRANEKSKLTNLVVEAGKFNRDSKETERRAMVETLLRDANGMGDTTEESTVPDDDQLNDMMASTPEELELYRQIDQERERSEAERWEAHIRAQGLDPRKHPKPPRLSQEIPPDAVEAQVVAEAEEAADLDSLSGGRKRKRKDVVYSDMTDSQFLRMVEGQGASEPGVGGGKAATATVLPAEVCDAMMRLFNEIRQLKDENGRLLSALFVDKPNPKVYTDYYKVIRNAIDLKTIRKRIKGGEYPSLKHFAGDFRLLFNNAMTYNVEESQVFQDASDMLRAFEDGYSRLQAKFSRLPTQKPPGGRKASKQPPPAGHARKQAAGH